LIQRFSGTSRLSMPRIFGRTTLEIQFMVYLLNPKSRRFAAFYISFQRRRATFSPPCAVPWSAVKSGILFDVFL
jgi:hypothetical protein